MIDEGDKIAVGISGGKDSLSLLVSLAGMRLFYPKKYEIEAITVSLGFDGMDFSRIKTFCDSMNINYTVIDTDIGDIIFNQRKEKNPCALCSKMRKGSLNTMAKTLGCNKIAYGHNKDDVIHTFFMSLFYEGRIHSFAPKSYLDRMDLTLIRPLIYVPENAVSEYAKANNLPITKSCCPADGNTKRQEIREFVEKQKEAYPFLEEKVMGAIVGSIDSWK